ncbi:predicted protein [Nematostella vectensis]|uniref:PX domain-containing protein n=1 Tax=Nematostella vectensis TaxID=45351 RepID=A7SQP0_NEMVE|nr:predicted protein [Nematostella vectensis]|eukprot:XP_001626045.1 predicted protein [Nematostella vectensis]
MAEVDDGESEGRVRYFPEGSLLNTMILSITDSEKRASEYIKEPFTVYLIESKYIDGGPPAGDPDMSCNLWRRYSEFELLRNYLVATYPAVIVPPLPEKRINLSALRLAADKFDPDFIEKRRTGLENFLLRCAAHGQLSQDPIFLGFLNMVEGWKDSVYATNFNSKVDSRLRSLSASMSLKKPDRRFEDMKHYADNLGTSVASMLKVRQHIIESTFSLHKNHAGYGKTLSEWSTLEKEMGDGLQKAGHYMDRLSASVDNVLEDDELTFADPLKEYQLFADVLKMVAKKQWLRQYDLEKAEEALSAKNKQRQDLETQKQAVAAATPVPKTSNFSFKGLSSMIFGAETHDTLEGKSSVLDEQIQEAEAAVEAKRDDLELFVKDVMTDYERFKRQEVRDLKAILAAHVKTQIKLCKMGMSTWQNMKETAQSL